MKRKRENPSFIWDHYKLFKQTAAYRKAECIHCGKPEKMYGSSTSNAIHHLLAVHAYQILKNVTIPPINQHWKILELDAESHIPLLFRGSSINLDLEPLSIVDHVGQRRVFQRLDPGYVLPSRRTLTRRLISRYDVDKAKVIHCQFCHPLFSVWCKVVECDQVFGLNPFN